MTAQVQQFKPFGNRVKTRKIKPNKRAKVNKSIERLVKLDTELKTLKNQ